MNALIQHFKNLWNEEEGVTAIEYGLLAALIAVVIILSVTEVGEELVKQNGGYENIHHFFNY